MMDNETKAWLEPMLAKRSPDAIRVLCDLLEAGLKNGECSANDVRDVRFDEPNVIGGCFKLLPKFGFVHTDRRVKTEAAKKHYRRVDVWELSSRGKAEAVIAQLRGTLLRVEENGQQLLAM